MDMRFIFKKIKLYEYSINIWVNSFQLRSKENLQDYDSKSKTKKEKIDKSSII